MNARLLIASAGVVLAAIGGAELLKPAEANAAGKAVATTADSTNHGDLTRGVVEGVGFSKEMKDALKKELSSRAKDAKTANQLEHLVEQIDEGRPIPGEAFQSKSYEQILEQAKADYGRVKKAGGVFTADLSAYLDNPTKNAYTPFAKVNEQLDGALGRNPATDPIGWGTTIGGMFDQDWHEILVSIGGLLPGGFDIISGIWGPAWDLYNAMLEGDIPLMAAAVLAMHAALFAMAYPTPAAVVGAVVAVAAIIYKLIKESQKDTPSATEQFREKRDQAWRTKLESMVKDVVAPKIDLERQRMEQDAMLATAFTEIALDDINNRAPDNQKLSLDQVVSKKNEWRQKLRDKNAELANMFKEKAPDAAVAETKAMLQPDISQKPFAEVFPSLKEAGLKTVTASMWERSTGGGNYWLFDNDQVVKVNLTATGEVKILEPRKTLQEAFPNWWNAGLRTVTGTLEAENQYNSSATWVFGAGSDTNGKPTKKIKVGLNDPRQVIEANPAQWQNFPTELATEGIHAVLPGYTAGSMEGSAQAHNVARHIVLGKQGTNQAWEVQFSPHVGVKVLTKQTNVNRFNGFKDTGFGGPGSVPSSPISDVLVLPGNSGKAYVFSESGKVGRIVKGKGTFGTATGTPFFQFTNTFLQKNYDDIAKAEVGNDWAKYKFPDAFNGVAWNLFGDKMPAPNENDLRNWGKSMGRAIYIPEKRKLDNGREIYIQAVHSGKNIMKDSSSATWPVQDSKDYAPWQIWKVRTTKDPSVFKFENSQSSTGSCLGLDTSNGAVLENCDSGTRNEWIVESSGDAYMLRHKVSGMVLDVPKGSTADGPRVIGSSAHGQDNQRFRLIDDVDFWRYKTFSIQSWGDDGRVVDYWQHQNGEVHRYKPNGTPNQTWTVVPLDSKYSQLRIDAGYIRNICLARSGTGAASGGTNSELRGERCDPNDARQQWALTRAADENNVRTAWIESGSNKDQWMRTGYAAESTRLYTSTYQSVDRKNFLWEFVQPKWGGRSTAGESDAQGSAAPQHVTVSSEGNDYTAKPGELLGKDGKQGLVTQVRRHDNGEPAEGVKVMFSVDADSGLYFDQDGKHVTEVTVTTGADGKATAPLLRAGDKQGDFTVTMTAVDAPGPTEGERPTGDYTVHVKK